jgi:hypothetical protein
MASPLEIDVVNDQDIHNFVQTRKLLRHSIQLPEDLVKGYEILNACNGDLPTPALRTANALFILCRQHLTVGTISLLRLYGGQMFKETRSAVEAAGLAYLIQQSEEDFQAFREDSGPAERRRARKRFTSARLFPDTIPQMVALKQTYDRASSLSHTNRMTFIRHIHTEGGKFYYQDIQQAEAARIPSFLYWLCNVHLAILSAAEIVFPHLAGDYPRFKKEKRYIEEKLWRFHDQYRAGFSGSSK